MSSRIKRRVTLEKSKDNSEAPRKPSVFDRLGPGAGYVNSREKTHVDGKEICRQWRRSGTCLFGAGCRFYHGPTDSMPSSSHAESSSRTKHSKLDKKSDNLEKSKTKSKQKKEELSSKEKKSGRSGGSKSGHHRHSSSKKVGDTIKSTVILTRGNSRTSPAPPDLEDKRKRDHKASWADEDSEDWTVDADQLDYKEEQMLVRKRQQLKRELELEEEKEQFTKHGTKPHSPSSSSGSESSSSDSSDSSSDSDSSSSSSSSSSSPRPRPSKKKKSSKEPGEIRERKKSKHLLASKDPALTTKSPRDHKAQRHKSNQDALKKHSSKMTSSHLHSKTSKERSDGGGSHASFNDKPDRSKRNKTKKKNYKSSKGSHPSSKQSIITGSNSIPLAKSKIKVPLPLEDKKLPKELFHRPPSPPGRYGLEELDSKPSHKRKERSLEMDQPNKRIRLHTPQQSVTQRFLSPLRRVEEVTRTVRRRSPTPPRTTSRMPDSPPPKHKPPPGRMGGRDYEDRSGYRGRSPPLPPSSDMKLSRKDRGKPGRLHEDSRRYDRDIGRNSPIIIDRMPPRSPPDRPHMGDKGRPLYRSDIKPNRSLSPRPPPRLHPRRSSPPDHHHPLHNYSPPDYPLYPRGGSYLDDRGGPPFSDYPPSEPLYGSPPYHGYSEFSRKEGGYLELDAHHERALLDHHWSPRHHSRGPEDDWDYPCPPEPLHLDGGYGGDRGRPRRPLAPPRKSSDWPRHDPRDRPFSPGRGPPLSKGLPPKPEPGSWERQSRHASRESRQERKRDDSRSIGDHRRHDSRGSDGRRRQNSGGSRKTDSRGEEERPKRATSPKSHHSKPALDLDRTKERAPLIKPKHEPQGSEKHLEEKAPASTPTTTPKTEPDSKKEKDLIKKEPSSKKGSVDLDDGDHLVVSTEDYSDWTDEDADLDILTKEDEFVEVKEVTTDDVISEREMTPDEEAKVPAQRTAIKEEPLLSSDLNTSGCVDYDPISDEDFEAMIEENDEKPSQPMETSPSKEQSRIAMALQVDWSSLMGLKSSQEPVTSVRQRLSPRELLLNMGFSQDFAGPELTAEILEYLAEGTKGSEEESPIMEHPVAAFHEIIRANKKCRERVFYNVGPFRKALCSRHDLHIRRLLAKPLDKVDWSAKRELSQTK